MNFSQKPPEICPAPPLDELGLEASPAAPTIAVVIVGYNAADHLREMLNSLAGQIDLPDEIIYYDDCSEDHSLSILHAYRSALPMLRIEAGATRLGVSRARNYANSLVRSDYIAVLDADDLFAEGAILSYRRLLIEEPDLDLIFADTVVFTFHRNNGKRSSYPAFTLSKAPVDALLSRPVIPFKHSSLIYRTTLAERTGGYSEDLSIKVDFELFIRFLHSGARTAKLDEAVSYHRNHRGQMSRDRIHGIQSYWKIIDRYESNQFKALLYKLIKGIAELTKMGMGR